MHLNIRFNRVTFDWDGVKWVEQISTLLPEDMVYAKITRLDTGQQFVFGDNLTRASHEDFIRVIFPICVTDAIPVKIEGARDYDNGGDFNDDYNTDYSDLVPPPDLNLLITYSNIFEIYGKDEFIDIYLVDKVADYNGDYNLDYVIDPQTYSNFHSIRKPFTNQVHFYDTTSSDLPIKWYAESLANNTSLEDFLGTIITTRNTMVCSEASFWMSVTKELYDTVYVEQDCGCGGNGYTTSSGLVETWTTKKVVSAQGKYFGWELDTKVDSNLRLHQNLSYYNNLSINEVYTYIDYGLERPLINGVPDYLLEYDEVEETLINFRGIPIDNRTFYIYDFNNYSPTAWVIDVPEEGDYLVNTKVNSYCCGQIVRTVEYVTKIVANRYVRFVKEPCMVTVNNLAFEPITLVVSKLTEKKGVFTFVAIDTKTIQHLEALEYKEGTDGVYKFEVSRSGIDSDITVDTYIHINYCEIQRCMQSVIEELMCKDLCKEKDFALFNIITVLYNTLMLKIQDEFHLEVWEKEYYNVLDNPKLDQLYTIQQLIDRLNRYCYDCKGLQLSDCNC